MVQVHNGILWRHKNGHCTRTFVNINLFKAIFITCTIGPYFILKIKEHKGSCWQRRIGEGYASGFLKIYF